MDVRTAPQRRDSPHAVADARLAVGISGACVLLLAVLLVTASPPDGAPVGWQPPGPGVLWLLGSLVTVVLAPVAIALCAWSSLVALWLHGDLPDHARRLHLATLVLAGAFAATFAAGWAGDGLTWFRG